MRPRYKVVTTGPRGPTGAAAASFLVGPTPNGVDDSANLRAKIATAATLAGDRDGPWVTIDLLGNTYLIGSSITFLNQDKVKFCNGRLKAVAGLGTNPIMKLGDGSAGNRPYDIVLENVQIECAHISAGILIADSVGHAFWNVNIHGQVGYGIRTQSNSGAGLFVGVNIRQYWSGETGWDQVANRTAYGFDIGTADDKFIACGAQYCLRPFRSTGGGNIVTACHFFNGGVVDSTTMVAAELDSGGGHIQFIATEFDNGCLRLVDSFAATVTGCWFTMHDGSTDCAINIETSTANSDAAGLGVVGCELKFNALPSGVIKQTTTGSGSWASDLKIIWSGNRRDDGSSNPWALDQWSNKGAIDSSGRLILGRTATQTINALDAFAQVIGKTAEEQGALAILNGQNNANPPHLILAKSRGGGAGSYSAVQTSDIIGSIEWVADQGTDLSSVVAAIKARASANFSGSERSTRLTFATRNTSGSLTDRLVLDTDGMLYPNADNTYTIGIDAKRWSAVYARKYLNGNGNVQWTSGSGSPEGVVAAPVGSLYSRSDGGAGTTFYVKESGSTGNTGWVAK